ncbi:MAG: HEAT repeat domain-containing protein [Euryarchaeota archaeon]|nr:HEAT repeat domain-containing protein [Euryarchaeota archaeon]
MVDQAEIHRKVVSGEVKERKDAAHQFKYNFAVLPDKEQVWEDLVRLAHDENGDVRWHAIYTIDVVFQHVSDKEQAWKDLHRLAQCEDGFVRLGTASAIGAAFQHIPDKEHAWRDLRRLAHDEDSLVRPSAVGAIGAAFQHIPDKKQAWDNLYRLVQEDTDHYARSDAARAIGTAFQYMPDKKHAWEDLHRLTHKSDSNIRSNAARAIGTAFQHIPDKKHAWEDIHRLAQDEDSYVRRMVVYALGDAFQHIPDKEEAWQDLHRLTKDKDDDVRLGAARVFGSAFQHIPKKDDAWKDLHRMICEDDCVQRSAVVHALGLAFQHIPDKKHAWKVLHRLTKDKDDHVRRSATDALGSDFQYVPEKEEAWSDLHRLTKDNNDGVRLDAASAVGSAFQHIPEKDEAWWDLIWLTVGKGSFMHAYANHSLGRASIFKATETESEDDFKRELKNALEFFETSSKEDTYYDNPSSFCLPFYRSFYTITFEEAGAKGEVEKYLAEAKIASEGSVNKEILLEAVENLANALSEAHKVTDFDVMKSELNSYRRYCDCAADLIGAAEEGTPGAARVLRRGLPIIDNQVREIIREIQEKAEAVRRETQGTSLEELGLATARPAQELHTQDPLALTMSLGSMASSARALCELITTDDERIHACEQLKNLGGLELSEQGRALDGALKYITACLHSHHNEPHPTKTLHISETQMEIVRIAVAQFCFELTESFPLVLKNKDEVKTKVFSALEIAWFCCFLWSPTIAPHRCRNQEIMQPVVMIT